MERKSIMEHPYSGLEKVLNRQLPDVRCHTRFKTGAFPFWQYSIIGDTDPLPPSAKSVVTVSQGEWLGEDEDGYFVHDHKGSCDIDGMPAAWIPKTQR